MNNNEERKSVASALRIFGWLIIWFGLIGGFVIANPSSYLGYGYDGIFLWPVAFGVWFGSAFSGALALGFAEVLDYLKDISHTLKSGSLNKGAINQPVDLVALANEKIYKEAKRELSVSNGKAQLIQVKEKLVPISDYKDVSDILITIENKIEQIDRETSQNEEKDLELRRLKEERRLRQNLFWVKHSKKVIILTLLITLVVPGLFYIVNDISKNSRESREIIDRWSGTWNFILESNRDDGFILNIKEKEFTICNDSICYEPIKIEFIDLSMETVKFEIDGIEHILSYKKGKNSLYIRNGNSAWVFRSRNLITN